MKKRAFIQAAFGGAIGLASGMLFAQPTTPAPRSAGPRQSLEGTDMEGKHLQLSDFNGKTLLVSFFTAGCALCNHDLKLMREFYVGNAKRNFLLLAVNIDDSKNDLDDYSRLISLAVPREQRFPMVWRNAPGHKDNFGAIARQPTHFVLDKQQQLVLRREGSFQPNDWDSLWERLDS
jgi:hypothetical protein